MDFPYSQTPTSLPIDMNNNPQIVEILQEMNKKLDKLNKLDDMDKKLGNIYDVLITTKAEISEKGILDIFRRFLKKYQFTSMTIKDMDMGEGEGKADFYIEAEREGRKYRFVLEVKNYLEDGENPKFTEILEKLKERARKWGAIPVLGARFMTTPARLEALRKGIWILTYNDQTNKMELIKP